jgi:hypothetical protein
MSKKKNSLKDLKQIDAKEEKGKPTTLDQLWGDTGLSKYGTHSLEEYKGYLKSLNRSDIQAHAINIGVLPTDNHEILVARLEREFLKYTLAYNTPTEKKASSKKTSKEVIKILSEGR